MSLSTPAVRPQRDLQIIGLIAAAHFSSHVMQLALPPLFPRLHEVFGASFTQLGLIATLFYLASGTGQALAGVLVDRYGAHRLLVGGITLLSLAILGAGLVTSYWMLLPLALLAGAGNSVFHPADLSILTHRVSEGRLGRAYATHGVAGSLGFASSPLIVAAIVTYGSWRLALILIGLGGLAVAATLFANRRLLAYEHRAVARAAHRHTGAAGYVRLIGTPVVLMAFAYFAVTSFAGSGIQSFSVTGLTAGYSLSLTKATWALTVLLFGVAGGMVLGGLIADRTQQHHLVAMGSIAAAAVFMFIVSGMGGTGLAVLPVMALAGIASGISAPSRDVLVRRAAQGSGTGSVFGFVYSGFDLGSSTAPLLFGALIDHHLPTTVFLAVACAYALAAPTVMQVGRRRALPAELPAGAD